MSVFEIAAEASDIWVPSLFLFTVHMIVWFTFALLYYILSLKSELMLTQYQSVRLFKKYSLLQLHLVDLFVFVIYPVFILMLIRSDAYKVSNIIDTDAVNIANTMLLIMIVLACMGVLFVKIKRIKLLRDETLEVGGEDVIERLTSEWKLLGSLKSWSGKRNRIRGYMFLLLPYLALVLFTIGILYLPEKSGKQRAQILWSIPLKDEEAPYFHLLEKADDRIIFSSSIGLSCHDPATGSTIWTIPVEIIDAEINSSGIVIALTRGSVISIRIDSGEITWESKFDTSVVNNNKLFDLLVFDDAIAIKGNDYISVHDEFTGQEIKMPEDFILPAIHDFSGSFYWLTNDNHLQRFNPDLTVRDLVQIQDSVIEYYTYPNSLIIRTENGISILDETDILLWERQFESDEIFNAMFLSDTILFMEFKVGIKAFSLKTSNEKWRIDNFRFETYGLRNYSARSYPIPVTLSNGFFASRDHKIYFIDKNSGEIQKVFENALNEIDFDLLCVGYHNNTLIAIGYLALSAYSFDDTRKLFDDLYTKTLIDEDPEYFDKKPDNSFLPNYVLLPYQIMFDEERMYVLNPFGLVALEIRNN